MQTEGYEKSPITCMTYDPLRDNLYTGHWAAMVCSFKCDSGKLRAIYKRYYKTSSFLKTSDMFGHCHRPVSSLGVSQHNASNNKPVNISTHQLVTKVARE